MRYQYTDKQLNELNWDRNVYSVNLDFAHKNDFEVITDKDKPRTGETNTIYIDTQQFQVIATKVDQSTGFDGMAVAPIVNGKVDYSSVAIVAAGTDPKSYINSIDGATAFVGKIFNLSPQYDSLITFIEEVQKMEGVRIAQLTGYSQGSYVLKAGAKYGIPATTFNGWFKYSSLTPKEAEFIRQHPGWFVDYRKKSDDVVVLNDTNNPYHYDYDYDLGTIVWLEGDSHSIKDWYFDETTGQVLDKKGGKPVTNQLATAVSKAYSGMASLAALKTTWEKNEKTSSNEGALSPQETIFLDAGQSYVLGTAITSIAQFGVDEMKALKTSSDTISEILWENIDFSDYTYLSAWEVRDIFAAQGVSYEKLVRDWQDETAKKVQGMQALATTFEGLKKSLDQAIEQHLAVDKKLGEQFKTWQNNL